MHLRHHSVIIALCALFFLCEGISAQPLQRVFGAGALYLDNRTTPLKGITINTPNTLTTNYALQLPSVPPTAALNVLASDADGNMLWASGQMLLPPLPPGNIWVGNASGVATPYAPTVPGAFLTLNASFQPTWSTVLPPGTTVSASQITSGTLPPGTVINVGPSSTIQPSGGVIVANGLNGSGVSKYSGSVSIPMNAITMNIAYPGIIPSSVVVISMVDPSGSTDQVTVTGITPGVGFTIQFAGFYPTPTGQLNYVVIN